MNLTLILEDLLGAFNGPIGLSDFAVGEGSCMFGTFRCFLCFLLGAAVAAAQVASGTITGTVHDSSDAVVQGAKVTLVQQETSESRAVTTNERGEFNASNLHVGQYTLTVTMSGF